MGKSKSNASLLVKAAEVGDAAQVALLLSEEGIRVNHTKEIGEDATPLGKAAFQGHGEVVKLLLDAGADVLATDDTWGGHGPVPWTGRASGKSANFPGLIGNPLPLVRFYWKDRFWAPLSETGPAPPTPWSKRSNFKKS